MIRKTRLILSVLALTLLLATTVFAAEGSWQTWKEGTVTRSTWAEDRQLKIEVDGIPYTFMPEARVYKFSKTRNGSFDQVPMDANRVFRFEKVAMLIQGFRIYQLKVAR